MTTAKSDKDPTHAMRERGAGGARLLRILAICFIAFSFCRYALWRPLTIHGVDYPKHWHAARAIAEGRSVYEGPYLDLGFNYPQWTAFIALWLAPFDVVTGEKLWKLMLAACLVGCWIIAARGFRPDPARLRCDSPGAATIAAGLARHWALVSALLLVLYSPALARPTHAGNIDPVNAIFSMGFVAAFSAGRERLSGVLWAMLCLIKIMPVSVTPVFLLGRRRRVLISFAAFMTAYALLLLALGRAGEEIRFFRELLPQVGFFWRGISRSLSQAVLSVVLPKPMFDDPAIYNGLTITILAFLAAVDTLAVTAVIGRGRAPVRALEIALLFTPMISPLFETHHLVWALPVLFLQARRWICGEMSMRALAFLAPGWCVVFMDNLFQNHAMRFGPGGTVLYYASMAGTWWLIAATTVEALARNSGTESRHSE